MYLNPNQFGQGFPRAEWLRAYRRALSDTTPGYPDPMGALMLRESIAGYLARRYGVFTSAQHIMIVNGSQQALFLCAQLLVDKGDAAAIEDPGYVYARWTFEQNGLSLTTMPVDNDGARVDVLRRRRKKPRIIYVTPGHQFPLGPVLTADRRLDLINFATQHGSWILEDDYDSEFRHNGRHTVFLAQKRVIVN